MLGGWPEHMYVNGLKEVPLHCLAQGCSVVFSNDKEIKDQATHYKHPGSGYRLWQIEHGILHQMHTIKRCMVCNQIFDYSDNRVLFNHVSKQHPGEADSSKIAGFLVNVRKYAHKFPEYPNDKKELRTATFKLAFEHAKQQLETSVLWPNFCLIIGCGDGKVPDDKLRSILTTPGPLEYYPAYPSSLLADFQYDETTSWLSKDEWDDVRDTLNEYYREGIF